MSLKNRLEALSLKRKEDLPQAISGIISAQELAPYDEAPDSINISRTRLNSVLNTFRRTVNKSTPGINETGNGSWLEIYQFGYSIDGKIKYGPPIKGSETRNNHLLASDNEPGNTYQRIIYTHSHPTPQSFSGTDIRPLFYAINPSKYLQIPLENLPVYPPIRLLLLQTTQGRYLSYPSKEIQVPTKTEAIEYGIINHQNAAEREILKEILNVNWQHLKSEYDCSPYMGQNNREESLFPLDTNEKGIALINLAWTRSLFEEFRSPLYFSEEYSSLFHRVTTVQDVFTDLKPKKVELTG